MEKIDYLQVLIEEHHMLFCELFMEPLKPKFHFLLHYPRLIRDIGPPRCIWSMRYEAYHKFLKSTANSTTSRKNLLLTLSIKDSLRFSYRILSKEGFSNTLQFGPSKLATELLMNLDVTLQLSEKAFSVQWFIINNKFYKVGYAIQLTDVDIVPIFGKIKHIVINDKIIYFILTVLETLGYSSKAHAFEIVSSADNGKFQLYSFDSPLAYSIHFTGDGRSVISTIGF